MNFLPVGGRVSTMISPYAFTQHDSLGKRGAGVRKIALYLSALLSLSLCLSRALSLLSCSVYNASNAHMHVHSPYTSELKYRGIRAGQKGG